MAAHISAAVVILAIFLFRNTLSYNIRAGTIVGIFLAIGLLGFWEFGMIAGANPVLLAAPVLATLLFGKRVGIWCTLIMLFMMILTAYSFVYGGRVFSIDFNINSAYVPSWIAYMLGVILSVAASIVAISMSSHHLAAALEKSRQSENELANLNLDLESQVLERTRELQEAIKHAEHQARTDVLTGLNNRRAFFEYAEGIDAQARRYKHSYVVAMVDVDHFKSVNDTWGHDIGDVVLVSIGNVISKMCRETDIIGRIGGEEFAVIMPQTDIKDGLSLANRLRKVIEETRFQTPQGSIGLTVSIGLALFSDDSGSLEKVMTSADIALYVAKNAGRNRVEVHQD